MGWWGRRRQQREDERVAAEELKAVIRMADKDTTLLGEQLAALGVESAGVELAGLPRPELRVPCFFNPQHGPSSRDVRYTVPGGHGTRTVPACAQDAARVEAGEKPEIRKVRVGQTDTPYWQAGDALLPYGKDWFTTGMLEVEGNRREGGLGGL